jgi:hypothetical protein
MATSDPNKTGPKAAEKAGGEAAAMDPANREQRIAGDASVTNTTVRGDVAVTGGASAPFSTKPGDVSADPRSGRPFADSPTQGLKGRHGFEVVDSSASLVPGVDPDRIPVEVTPGVTPDAGGDKLFAAALAKAPSLTREFVDKMGITRRAARADRPG